ncbi:MAG: polyprenol monophosphomannose synthase [Patescibacteria group bacterium]|jgi:dolichol-phosphate mannosyltransferase
MPIFIIIPTYNEKDNISQLIPLLFQLIEDANILVVDDNSPDGTGRLVKNLASRYPQVSLLHREKKQGLGRAYLAGFKNILSNHPEARKIIMMDADFSHDPKFLPAMIKESKKYDVVIGSRYIPGGGVEGWEPWRRFLSCSGNIYCRLICRLPIRDFTAGFYVINAKKLGQIDLSKISSSGYAFQIELKYELYKASASFREFPIIFKNRVSGESKISCHIIREGLFAPWRAILRK